MKSNIVILVFSIILISCSAQPVPIQFGHDACDFCKMIIMDPKFGAELVTTKGKAYKFDDINCLINFAEEERVTAENVAHWLVIDFKNPEKLINAEIAFFTRSNSIKSPMASHIASFYDEESRAAINTKWEEPVNMNWEAVKKAFK